MTNMVCINGVWVPQTPAEKIGLGCPKHDDHELVPTNQREHDAGKICSAFRNKHRGCGELETLEVQNGHLIVTGKIPALAS
jgi:hypothetical protein